MVTIQRPFNPFIQGGLMGNDPRMAAPLISPEPMAPQGPPQMPSQLPRPAMDPALAGATPMAPMAPAGPGGGNVNGFLGSDSALALAAGILEGGTSGQALGRGFNYALQARQKKDAPTTNDIQNFAFAKQQGYEGSFPEYLMEVKRAGATNVTVGGDGAPGLGKLSADYGYVLDPNTREPIIDPETGLPRAAPIPGSPGEAEAAVSEDERASRMRSRATVSGFIQRDLRYAKEYLEKSSDNPYVRYAKSYELNSPEFVLSNSIDSVRRTIAIDQLLDIKRQGSGLGQVPQRQLEHLSDLLGVLDIRLPKERLGVMLDDIYETYNDILRAMTPEDRAMIGIAEREFELGPSGSGGGAAGGGWTVEPLE